MLTLFFVVSGLLAAAPAPADPVSCGLQQGFRWCDHHWRWDDLPVEVYAKANGIPSGVTSTQFAEAVRAAVQAWELPAGLIAQVPPSNGCPGGTRILCYKGTTFDGKAVDGKTVVAFGTVSGSSLGETRWWCTTGATCSGAKQLVDADVTLRSAGVSWHQASPAEAINGEVAGPRGPYGCQVFTCPNWYDLQSIITHELGHVIGLDDVGGLLDGCSAGQWPGSDFSDAVNYLQTMYPCHWKGLTNRRTVDVGDLAGLATVFLSSWLDS